MQDVCSSRNSFFSYLCGGHWTTEMYGSLASSPSTHLFLLVFLTKVGFHGLFEQLCSCHISFDDVTLSNMKQLQQSFSLSVFFSHHCDDFTFCNFLISFNSVCVIEHSYQRCHAVFSLAPSFQCNCVGMNLFIPEPSDLYSPSHGRLCWNELKTADGENKNHGCPLRSNRVTESFRTSWIQSN